MGALCQDAAFQVYQQLRSEKPSRISLVKMATQSGLDDAANLFLGNALQDFPKSKKLKTLREKLKGQ